jgi:hypothetical protein
LLFVHAGTSYLGNGHPIIFEISPKITSIGI